MSPEAVGNALPVLGTVGIMGLFLPSIETAWNAQPHGADTFKVRRGESAYIASAVAIGALAAYAQRSLVPLFLAGAFAVLVVGVYEHALRTAPQTQAA